jgi:hypothetical protein
MLRLRRRAIEGRKLGLLVVVSLVEERFEIIELGFAILFPAIMLIHLFGEEIVE